MDEEGRPDALLSVRLSERTEARPAPPRSVRREREQAILDLRATAHFSPVGLDGPFHLRLGLEQSRLVFDVRDRDDRPLRLHALSLGPLRHLLKDYLLIVESHEDASRAGTASRVQAIDMARRVLHDEAADVLIERLRSRIDIDHQTARRLFTVVAALFQRR